MTLSKIVFISFAGFIVKLVDKRHYLSANAMRVIWTLFALAVIVVVGDLWLKGSKLNSDTVTTLQQQTEGRQSPAISSGKDVNIQYGTPVQPHKPSNHAGSSDTGRLTDPPAQENSTTSTIQQTTGAQSPAIQSGGDVNIQFENSQ